MGFVGCFLSMAKGDMAASNRVAALKAGLAIKGVTDQNATIQFEYAFDPINMGDPVPDFPGHAGRLVMAANAGTPPKVLFASCWPTLNALSSDGNFDRNTKIIHAGLFHQHHNEAPPLNNFGDKVGGIYSHTFKHVCDSWVNEAIRLSQLATFQLSAIAVINDTTQVTAAKHFRNYIRGAASPYDITITPINVSNGSTIQTVKADLNAFVVGNGNDCRTLALIVPMGAFTAYKRNIIIQAANMLYNGRYLPAIYPNRMYVENTYPGLMSYGAAVLDQYFIAGLALGDVYNGLSPYPSTLNQNFERVISSARWTATFGATPMPPGAVVVP